MFLGHGLAAFAGAAGVASLVGYGRERALALGLCAAVTAVTLAFVAYTLTYVATSPV